METTSNQRPDMERFQVRALQVIESVKTVITGNDDMIVDLFIAMLAGGNVLLEGVPGVAKTSIAKAFASALGVEFKRVQFVPDILPGDIIGMSIYNQHTGAFETRKGPIFTNILLVDEINRASPKIQSALLEAMEEKQVSIDGTTYRLPAPFMVITTQNPIDIAGTFPLPEAQIDRFMFKLDIGYLSPEDELDMLRARDRTGMAQQQPVLARDEIAALVETVGRISIDDIVLRYIRDLIVASRSHDKLLLGGSPRASIALMKASKAYAAINGRDYVIPDDVKYLVPRVMSHRLIVKPELELENVSAAGIVEELLDEVPVPA